ncbi:MAG TPA: hypothetical protein VGN79_03115 [Devosia sp.]|nr:hypothetical protein [Devosia sp.]
MTTEDKLWGCAAASLILATGLVTPAWADKITREGASPLDQAEIPAPSSVPEIDFGDDSGEWANDGECDDPRFSGEGTADELVEADRLKDATDCRAALEAGTITFTGDAEATTLVVPEINFGDDTSEWANDGECDDPRFAGPGAAEELVGADLLKDATDCRAAYEAGTVTYTGDQTPIDSSAPGAFDYGGDTSTWAKDGECDDPRFTGPGMAKKLLSEDSYADATDCRTLEAEGKVAIRTVYTPEYAAGAPYDSDGVEFGDNSSSYANDDTCDDPRFEGPGAAALLLDGDRLRDANDCRAAYEGGTVTLIESERG